MIPRDVKSPTVAIPFHKMLKIVAIIDRDNSQAQALVSQITADGFEVELRDDYSADVSEDADVGAYIGSVEGGKLPAARSFLRSVREIGFRTPIWAMADTLTIADMPQQEIWMQRNGWEWWGEPPLERNSSQPDAVAARRSAGRLCRCERCPRGAHAAVHPLCVCGDTARGSPQSRD